MIANLDANFLIADADSRTRRALAEGLRGHGYEICEADSGRRALDYLGKQRFAGLILDPNQLGMNDAELMRQAREMDQDLQIIICTATPTIDSTIAAIRANVFDYVLKPCTAEELNRSMARALDLRAKQTRRERLLSMVKQVMSELETGTPDAKSEETFTTSAKDAPAPWLDLDREKRMVMLQTVPPQAVELTEGEVALLSALMATPNHVLTCAQLAQTALGYNGMDKWTVESVIRSSVFRLRQKLEPSPEAPKVIHTVRGRGYYFAAQS